MRKLVEIFTDGACSGNPGPGGWGAILRCGAAEKELSGGDPSTTNNRMELLAVITALEALKEPCTVTLTSDSRYVINAVNEGWVFGWKRKEYAMPGGEIRPNADLWDRLLPLLRIHDITFVWVHGHQGHPENERCDKLAVGAYQQWIK